MLTTHEKIRTESGFQHFFTRVPFANSPDGGSTTFFLTTDDRVKLVPNFGTGVTVAGVSDIEVWSGSSGTFGASRMNVSSIDVDTGAVTLDAAPDAGISLTAEYASSPIDSRQIEDMRLQAESIVNQRLAVCYELPITPTPSVLTSLTNRLASALLLIRNYGVVASESSVDGYALYEQLLGKNEKEYSDKTGMGVYARGEIGMICTRDYVLIDDNGNIIPRKDVGLAEDGVQYTDGGRIPGRLYDVTEEDFRFKKSQLDADTRQAGSADKSVPPVQG